MTILVPNIVWLLFFLIGVIFIHAGWQPGHTLREAWPLRVGGITIIATSLAGIAINLSM